MKSGLSSEQLLAEDFVNEQYVCAHRTHLFINCSFADTCWLLRRRRVATIRAMTTKVTFQPRCSVQGPQARPILEYAKSLRYPTLHPLMSK
jgi:hypothetical protein